VVGVHRQLWPEWRGRVGLAALFAVAGALHLTRPHSFEQIVPPRLPAKRALVYVSGAVELVCAAGLMVSATRRVAGLVSAGLLVAIFPANVQMAVDSIKRRGPLATSVAVARLPLQVPMIKVAWRAWSSSPG
jgi:uncharacterized membrane protein